MELKIRNKSMMASGEKLANAEEQLKIINQSSGIPLFDNKFELTGNGTLTSGKIESSR